MTKGDEEDYQKSTNCWICDNTYVDGDVKLIDHCHITGKYRGSGHRDCKVNVKLNHKIPIVFYNLRSYMTHILLCKNWANPVLK